MQFRWWPAVLIVASLFLSGCISQPSEEEQATGDPAAALAEKAGPRFLQQVDWPEPLVNGFYEIGEDEEEVPGDMKDDSLLITDRGGTYWDYWDDPVEEGFELSGVHGTPSSPYCFCDVEITFRSKHGEASRPYISFRDSSWILIDNVTLNGGPVQFIDTHNVTVMRSVFVDDAALELIRADDIHVIDNVFVRHQGPLQVYDGPNSRVPELDECFPMELCLNEALVVFVAGKVVFEFNRVEAGTAAGTLGSQVDEFVIRHNSMWTSMGGGFAGKQVEYSWNIVSGMQGRGVFAGDHDGASVHNNSFILKKQIHPRGPVLEHADILIVVGSGPARVHDNDFLVAPGVEAAESRGSLLEAAVLVEASRNFWGTLHDPRIPEGVWINPVFGGEVLLDDWRFAPLHPVQIPVPFYAQEAPYWLDHLIH